MPIPEQTQPEKMGWSGYICRSCTSVVLVGVAPLGQGSMAIPVCPALTPTYHTCEGLLNQLGSGALSDLLKALGKTTREEIA